MPRSKEYRHREIFTSAMDAEKLARVREISAITNIPMNSFWNDKADELIEQYSQGMPILREGISEKDPRLLDGVEAIMKWAYTTAKPEDIEKTINIMTYALEKLKANKQNLQQPGAMRP